MLVKNLGLLSFFALSVAASSAQAAPILLVDISGRGNQIATWQSDLSALGYADTLVTPGHSGDLTTSLSGYSTVIVSNGDTAYTNLSVATVNALASYLSAGGKVLYAGAHSWYSEPNGANLAAQYFGIHSYNANMPMFSGSSATATGVGAIYTLTPWSGGQYKDMLSAFAVNTGTTDLLDMTTGWTNETANATALASVHTTGTSAAATWGFDINYLSSTSQQLAFLGETLNDLGTQNVPEPGTLALLGLGLTSVSLLRKRKGAQAVAA